ncbi:MAG: response regulator [Lachnospiraceae bacterium]|nr:response regulator [Lachnospiraceae bacterium]
MDSKDTRPTNTVAVAVIGSLAVMFLLVIGTIMMGQYAKKDTETAVRSVSLLYLDELAGRREQVVAENLRDRISDMKTALDLITEEDLSDDEHRQAYQKKMKALFGLEKFAFVGEDGLIYTSTGVQDNIDEYGFDYRSLKGPEISILNLTSSDKKVIIAMPVDLMSDGHRLVASFMEIDMDEMLSGVSLQSQDGGATFCNIYTAGGVALSNTVLGGLAQEDNLLEALKNAEFEPGYSYDSFLTAFKSGEKGEVSFTYNGIKETLAFVPVDGTDWLLTHLIRESVISEKISSISDGIIMRSVIQSVLTVLVLLAVFAIMLSQMRRNEKLRIERETADAENRVRQQELEHRIALQEKLLEEEKQRTRQDQMITAMSSDYRSVYYVNIDTDDAVCIRDDPKDLWQMPAGKHFQYHKRFAEYCSLYVDEEYREGFLRFIDPENVRKSLENESIVAYRYLARRDGAEYYEMLRMAGVRHPGDREDHMVHVVGVGFTDIDTEMRETMQRNQALAEALRSAEEANKAKTAFLSNMCHEIRTPMNAIIGLDSLALRKDNLDEETRGYLEKIGGSARHLLSIINDILDMSRIESGRLIIKREEFSLRGMLEQINTMVMSQCSEKGLRYECHVVGGVSDYYIGDDVKLRQVLLNILSNAVKFTEAPGHVTLTVERTAVYGGHSTLRFSVKDTGIGMDAEFIPKLFEAFTQEDNSRNNRYGSTGLGMAITRNIVELMNGTISVESEKGVGTEFTVVLTLTNSSHRESAYNYISPKDIRILIVDDDDVAAEHARIVLDEVGIKADTCYSGRDAMHMLEVWHTKKEPYNLVLLDWKMPEMDGLEVTKEIRKRYNKETTVIILTSYDWDEIFGEAVELGVDSFLAKPLFAGTVLEEFERVARKNEMSVHMEKKRADLKGRRILMAEDVLVNAEIMKQIIMIREADIDHAENGRIALEMFADSEPGHYDAILMDVRMPEMDGLQATAAIRALKRPDAKTIPIIALTANAFDEDVQRSLQVGMNAHLSKPVEPEHLFRTLEELIWEAEQNTQSDEGTAL